MSDEFVPGHFEMPLAPSDSLGTLRQPPTRSWWKRKRWAAAAAFWLALPVIYPFTALPFSYLNGRGWLGERAQYWEDTIYEPADWALTHPPLDRMALWMPWVKSRDRCWDLGMRHQFQSDD